jgi:hypothetical protein
VLVGVEHFKVREPVARARLHVVGEGVVDDVEAKRAQLVLDPRQPDVAGRAAAIAMNEDRFCRGGQAWILPE